MNYSDYQTLTVTRDGHLLYLEFNRPEVKNAANSQMELELCSFFRDVNRDAEARVVILSGAGDVFSAGGDFAYMRDLAENPHKSWDGIQLGKQLIFTMLDCVKPVIAKINGHAIGLGATLALFCDVSFAAEHARIGDPHVTLGFVAGDGGAVIWPQLIGYNRAKEYLFSGEALTAVKAAEIGLINHAVPAEQLDAEVKAYADKVASMPARAVQWTKATVNIGLKQLAHSIMDASMAYEVLSNSTGDHREALAALLEKRTPNFTGN
ncbi:MAG: enoyl-CoA hydratase-related protein [Tissierellales bacterium]